MRHVGGSSATAEAPDSAQKVLLIGTVLKERCHSGKS